VRTHRPQQVLAIDQGTTSTRAIAFDPRATAHAIARRELRQFYPAPGWVEHDPEAIWQDTLACVREVLAHAQVGIANVAALGITNQRETTLLWERATGVPLHRAIVWQDRRTAERCQALKRQGAEALVRAKTGLLLDPYFSATKLAWLLDTVPDARRRALRGELAFGTVDSFLLWRLTGGRVHATDVTNAARTLLYDIHAQRWDPELLELFGVPAALLPEVRDNSGLLGTTAPELFGRALPITGMAGDQQAALIGQACFSPGSVKSTYGTGCFLLVNTGPEAVAAGEGLLTTPAYRLGGRTVYAIEGSIFVAGAVVKWLRDTLQLISSAPETEALAARTADNHGVYLVPAFVGLGAPYWRPDARGLLCGLTFETSPAQLARAALESVAYQTLDLLTAMGHGGTYPTHTLRVDGGMAGNDWFCQFLADLLEVPVERPTGLETTALGAAFLAGLASGVWSSLEAVGATFRRERLFTPRLAPAARAERIAGWRDAVERTLLHTRALQG
jgi:glycerol kinase